MAARYPDPEVEWEPYVPFETMPIGYLGTGIRDSDFDRADAINDPGLMKNLAVKFGRSMGEDPSEWSIGGMDLKNNRFYRMQHDPFSMPQVNWMLNRPAAEERPSLPEPPELDEWGHLKRPFRDWPPANPRLPMIDEMPDVRRKIVKGQSGGYHLFESVGRERKYFRNPHFHGPFVPKPGILPEGKEMQVWGLGNKLGDADARAYTGLTAVLPVERRPHRREMRREFWDSRNSWQPRNRNFVFPTSRWGGRHYGYDMPTEATTVPETEVSQKKSTKEARAYAQKRLQKAKGRVGPYARAVRESQGSLYANWLHTNRFLPNIPTQQEEDDFNVVDNRPL
jgi:hypothetical protein